jgi:ribosome maturation factor RimP
LPVAVQSFFPRKKLEWAESSGPFFLLDRFITHPISKRLELRAMGWRDATETSLKGLGYELVDAEKSAGGLVRVYIDHAPGREAGAAERSITVDDCERATRQLQHVLEVEGLAYQRLEVSSPGLDRPLRKQADYERFAGHMVDLTLKLPFEGRKRYRGELQPREGGWRLVLADLSGGATAARRALDFGLDEVREARLVPVLDFKGRRVALQGAEGDAQAAVQADEEVDGGPIQ